MKIASCREIFCHTSSAVSWMVSGSPVLKADRTSAMRLRILLVEAS